MASVIQDSVLNLLTQVQSGLVVSGNSNLSIGRQFVSGDMMTSFRQSGTGKFEMIEMYLIRQEASPLVGGPNGFNMMADYTKVDFYVKYDTRVSGLANPASGAIIAVQQRLADFKVTVLSGTWSSGNTARPYLVAEQHPMAQQGIARGSLTYRSRYLI